MSGGQCFLPWCQLRACNWQSVEELDGVLVTFFDEAFFRGRSVAVGERLLAAIPYYDPKFTRLGPFTLVRSWRAIRSWSKLASPFQRPPFPFVALAAVRGWLLRRNKVISALALLVLFRTYLRP